MLQCCNVAMLQCTRIATAPLPVHVTMASGQEEAGGAQHQSQEGQTPAQSKSQSGKTREKWLCDFCKEVSFDTFEEASRHEDECAAAAASAAAAAVRPVAGAGSSNNTGGAACCSAGPAPDNRARSSCPSSPSPSPHPSSPSAGAINAANATASPKENENENENDEANDDEAKSKHKPAQRVMYLCDFCRVAQFETHEEACQHEDSCRLLHRDNSNIASDGEHGTDVPTTSALSSNAKRPTCKREEGGQGPDTGKPTISKGASNANGIGIGPGTPNPKALAAIFTSPRPIYGTCTSTSKPAGAAASSSSTTGQGNDKNKKPSPGTALLREHKAAEASARFAAERKRKRDEERERKRQREEAAAAAGSLRTGATATASNTITNTAAAGNGGMEKANGSVTVASIFARTVTKTENRLGEASLDTCSAVIDLSGAKDTSAGACKSLTSEGRKRKAAATTSIGQKKKNNNNSSKALAATAADELFNITNQPTSPSAPRFPNPSHLIGSGDSWAATTVTEPVGRNSTNDGGTIANESIFVSTEGMDVAANTLVTSARYQQGDNARLICSGGSGGSSGCADQQSKKDHAPSKDAPLFSTGTAERRISACTTKGCMHPDEDLARVIASVMSPPPVSIDDGAEADNELWSAKHGVRRVPGDVCGGANKESAKSLMTFIGEWKAHRAEFVKKMEAKRKSLGSRKKKGTKKGSSGRNYYDDDIWCDTDDEDLGLCNIFLLNGPHGTGKSTLVHAAARQTGCALLEINTTEKRGGSALKRAIEECTQSHSSLALLKRGPVTALDDPGAVSLQPGGAHLGRLDGESESEYGDNAVGQEGEEDGVDRGRLAIILIDEVDNIFENDGDAGFWVALASLSKKAKCPIVLTSSNTPMLLETSSIRYQAAPLCRPLPEECAATIRHVALQEQVLIHGISGKEGDDECDRDALLHIAELCSCDLRSILNAMQLHCHGSSLLSAVGKRTCCREKKGYTNDTDRCQKKKRAEDASPMMNPCFSAPEILQPIFPSVVDGVSHSVLTIRGRNFVGTNEWVGMEVLIGDRSSPSLRVIDDTTILAISPPCVLPKGVDSSGIFETTFEPCVTSRYLPIVVKGVTKSGLVARSDSAFVSAPGKHWNVAYFFPESQGRLEDMCNKREEGRDQKRLEDAFSSDDEDFAVPRSARGRNDEGKGRAASLGQKALASVASMASENKSLAVAHDDVDIASLLEKASRGVVMDVKKCGSEHNNRWEEKVKVKDAGSEVDDREIILLELQEIVKELKNSSDAVLLEKGLCSIAMPLPSGAIRGFASDFIDLERAVDDGFDSSSKNGSKKLRSRIAKPPSIEKVYALGWNDSSFFFGASDSFLTLPFARHDRNKLSKALTYPLLDKYSVANHIARHDSEDHNSMNALSFLSNSSFGASEGGVNDTTSPHDNDCSVQLGPWCPTHDLPLSLWSKIKHPPRDNLALLTMRGTERAMHLLSTSLLLFEDIALASSFCFGLEEVSNEKSSVVPTYLDVRFVLDYLPCLKAMAMAEDVADTKYLVLKEKNPGALGMQVGGTRQRSTRRSARAGRVHYFDRLISGQGRSTRHEEARTLAKQVSGKLSREVLQCK